MRVILDTNVLTSGLLVAQGAPARLLDAWERNRFALVACENLIAELRDVAGRPFFKARLRASAAELLAAGLRDFSIFCQELPSALPHRILKIVICWRLLKPVKPNFW